MPTKIPHPLVFWIAKVADRQVAHALEFLKAENETLRARITKPIVLKPDQRARLIKLGKPLGSAVRNLLTIVSYTTFLRWLRESAKKPEQRQSKKNGSA